MDKVEGRQSELYADYLSGLSLAQIAKKYHVHLNTVFHLFKRHKLSARNSHEAHKKYYFNKNAFDNITAEGTYWLGFIYADGYIEKQRPILRITLNRKDKIILENFKKFLKANNPIYYDHRGRDTVTLQLIDKHFIQRLKELGANTNKTQTIQFPFFLPKKYYSDFIRGYFDGDGSLYINIAKTDQPRFTITSNPIMVYQIQRILMKACNLKYTEIQNYSKKYSSTLRYGGRKQVNRILNYLTKNKGFYLPRKIGRWLPSQI